MVGMVKPRDGLAELALPLIDLLRHRHEDARQLAEPVLPCHDIAEIEPARIEAAGLEVFGGLRQPRDLAQILDLEIAQPLAFHRRGDARAEHQQIEVLGQEIIGAELDRIGHARAVVIGGGDDNHGHVRGRRIGLERLQHLEARHARA